MIIRNNILISVTNDDIKEGKFEIPDSVTSIGWGAFEGCSSLKSVVIPDSVTSIGDSAFRDCSSLTSVEIPDSVTSIGNYAFQYCHNLTSLVVPDSVTSIRDRAFQFCSSLKNVVIGSSVTGIGNFVFAYCTSLTSVVIGDNVTSIGEEAFKGCDNLTSKKSNYKAFNIKNGKLYCLNKEYKEGVKNSVRGNLVLCQNGIHYCTNLFEIFNYYCGNIDEDIAIYEIEVGKNILQDKVRSKCCTNSCVLKKRLYREDVIRILSGEV